VNGLIPLSGMLAILLLVGCSGEPEPLDDRAALAEIRAEARTLMRAARQSSSDQVPVEQLPPAIAALRPERVTLGPDGVDINIATYFDGGWGYFTPRDETEAPEPEGRFRELDRGLYWYHPY
jgi:hypothetical protein